MRRKVHFAPNERTRVLRGEAYMEVADNTVCGLMSSLCLLILWGTTHDIPKNFHLVFGICMVMLILACILKPLSVVKKHKIEWLVTLTIGVFQSAGSALVVWKCPETAYIALLAVNVITGGKIVPVNISICRGACLLVIISTYNFGWIIKCAALAACTDLIFQVAKYYYQVVRRNKESKLPLIRNTIRTVCLDRRSQYQRH